MVKARYAGLVRRNQYSKQVAPVRQQPEAWNELQGSIRRKQMQRTLFYISSERVSSGNC